MTASWMVILDEVKGCARAVNDRHAELRHELGSHTLAEVYEDCARHDQRTVLALPRLDYFRAKFDQRDEVI